ncbi:MAG: glycosyltransferase family 2 protein [Acidimicrobiales bacterium]|nr:glycosyltransferase family 2 protein [Acidimicrobiales bacterium]
MSAELLSFVTRTDALGSVTTPWVALLDPADRLIEPGVAALHAALGASDADLVYTDEIARLAATGAVAEVLKPGWSPRLLREGNYVGGIAAFRTEFVRANGGFTSDRNDALLQRCERVAHLAVTAIDTSEAGLWPATGEHGRAWRDVRLTNDRPKVSIVVPTKDRLDLLRRCIGSVEQCTSYPDFEIVVVDNGTTDRATLDYLASLPHTVIRRPGPFNFSWLINEGVAASTGSLLLLLNNDTEMHQADWLDVLVDEMADPTVGAVGCRLVGVAGDVQHEGIALGLAGLIAVNVDLGGYCGFDAVPRDVVAVTAAVVLVRRDAFDAVGHFDEDLPVGFGDVEFCLRLREAGYRTIYTPRATVTHLGQASRAVAAHREDDFEFSARYPLHRSREIDPFVNRRIERFSPLWVTAGTPFAEPPTAVANRATA